MVLQLRSPTLLTLFLRGGLNEGIGMFGVTGLTGLAIGPVIGEILITEFGPSFFFLAATGMATLGLIIHLPLSETFVHDSRKSSQSFFSVLIKRKFLFVALLAFLFGFGLAASGSFVSPFAQRAGNCIYFPLLHFLFFGSSSHKVLRWKAYRQDWRRSYHSLCNNLDRGRPFDF